MNLFSEEPREPSWFGGEAPPAVQEKLSAASAAFGSAEIAEAALRDAYALDPDCLPVYYLRYKFYFRHKRLEEAAQVAEQALAVAARLAGIPADWRELRIDSCDWSRIDAPQHFYLFSLKALSFIRLRLGRAEETREMLAKLGEIDPKDSVGACVIRQYAAGAAAA